MSQYPQDPSQYPPPPPGPQDPTVVQPAYQAPPAPPAQPAPPPQPAYQQPVQPTYQQPAYAQPAYQQQAYTPLPPVDAGSRSGGKASRGGTVLVGLVALALGVGGGYLLGSRSGGDTEALVAEHAAALEELEEANQEVVEELEDQIAELQEQQGGGGGDEEEEEPAEEEESEEPAEEEEGGGGGVVSSNEAVQAYCDAVDEFVAAGGNDPAAAQALGEQASQLATAGLSIEDLQVVGECSSRLVGGG